VSADHKSLDHIVEVISRRLSLSESVVREAIKVLLEFARRRLTNTKFQEILAQIPGVSALLAEIPNVTSSGGGGIFSSFGDTLGDVARVFSGLQAAGLQSGQIVPFVQAFIEKAREIVGPETVEELLKQIPMLKSLMKS
jgi:hypothetical protein